MSLPRHDGRPVRRRLDVSVVLPAAWHVIPLADPAGRERTIRRLVHDTMPGDDLAMLAAQMRDVLSAAAADAARIGGRRLALSLMRASNGVPVPASLVVSLIEVPDRASPTPESMFDVVREVAGGDTADGTSQHVSTSQATIQMGSVVRVVRQRATVPVGGIETEVPTLAADYWIGGSASAVAHLAFATPLVLLREAMLELFDTITASARWRPATTVRREPG